MGKLFDVSLVFSSIPELLTKLPITLELAAVSYTHLTLPTT